MKQLNRNVPVEVDLTTNNFTETTSMTELLLTSSTEKDVKEKTQSKKKANKKSKPKKTDRKQNKDDNVQHKKKKYRSKQN